MDTVATGHMWLFTFKITKIVLIKINNKKKREKFRSSVSSVTLRVLRSHMGPVPAALDSAGSEHFIAVLLGSLILIVLFP